MELMEFEKVILEEIILMECNEVWEGEIGRNGELVEFEKVILEKIILMECNEVEIL